MPRGGALAFREIGTYDFRQLREGHSIGGRIRMGVQIGQILGRYRIVEQIGAGGMGVVYRAHDEKLARDLAVKVLAPGSLDSAAARKRFRNEALILSKLNHPAIQVIHDFDSAGDVDYLVSELVPGVSLDARLTSGPLPEKDVVRIGVQLAQGLAAAHGAGVLHRDLKPANLKVTPDGHLKILDFGLATLSSEAIQNLSTTLSVAEAPAAVGGTLPYMAPEQLLGNEADERADIYSAGVALYELATCHLPFGGALVTALSNNILHQTPLAPSSFNRKISPELDRILLKCLEKDPELRYQSAKDLAADLRRMEVSSGARVVAVTAKRRRVGFFFAVLGSGALAALLFLGIVLLPKLRAPGPKPLGPLTYEQLTNFADSATSPALSADGKMLTFVRGENTFLGPGQIYVKFLPNGEPAQVTGDSRAKMGPIFSPDNDRVVYTTIDGTMSSWMVPTAGGQAKRFLWNASGLQWVRSSGEIAAPRVIFSQSTGEGIHMGVYTANEDRSHERQVYLPADLDGMAHRSYPSPDGKWVLIVEMNVTGWLPCRLVPYDGSSQGKQVGPVPAQCTTAAWSPDGKWMYFSANNGTGFHIWRQGFPDGKAEQVTSGASEEQGVSFAPDGKSFVTAIGTSQSTLWVHRSGEERQITSEGFAFRPSFSRVGHKLYYLVRTAASTHFVSGRLWSADLDTGTHERLLPDANMEDYDVSPDGKSVVFVNADASGKSPLWIAPLDGTAAPRLLTSMDTNRALFGASGDVYFSGGDRKKMFLYHIKQDGTELKKISEDPVLYLYSISADEKWAALWRPSDVVAQPLNGGPAVFLMGGGTAGEENRGVTPPMVAWSWDMKYLYLHFPDASRASFSVPLPKGKALPMLPADGIPFVGRTPKLPGLKEFPQQRTFGGPTPEEYAYPKVTTQRNIYRVRLD